MRPHRLLSSSQLRSIRTTFNGIRTSNASRISRRASIHPSFYSSSRFTLNLTRADMVEAGYSPSVRLFEASACGTPILSDAWQGLDQFLTPGEEILLPTDSYEVVQILTTMSDEEGLRIGRKARTRILVSHRSQHRAAEFETIVERCYDRRSRSQETVAETM
jgi:spore maturation protein CgeB